MDTKHSEDLGALSVRPLLCVYRPFEGGIVRGNLRKANQTDVIDGRTCSVIEFGDRRKIWVDPTRDFIALRFTTQVGPERGVVDLSYRHDKAHGWVPEKWKIAIQREGQKDQTVAAAVVRYEINVGIPRSQFQFEFPPGTVVIDMRNDGQRYIVKANGEKGTPPDN